MGDNVWTCAGREEQAAKALEDLVNGVRLPLIRADTDPHTAMIFLLAAFDGRGVTIGIQDATIAGLHAEIGALRAEIRAIKHPDAASDDVSMADLEILTGGEDA